MRAHRHARAQEALTPSSRSGKRKINHDKNRTGTRSKGLVSKNDIQLAGKGKHQHRRLKKSNHPQRPQDRRQAVKERKKKKQSPATPAGPTTGSQRKKEKKAITRNARRTDDRPAEEAHIIPTLAASLRRRSRPRARAPAPALERGADYRAHFYAHLAQAG
jgi:hypothetical protein